MMGFDPLGIKFIWMAHEMGLGCGDIRDIEIVGSDISGIDWNFSAGENTLFSSGQKSVYWGPFKPLENAIARSPLVNLAIAASNLYHNGYWLPLIGRPRVKSALNTDWGNSSSPTSPHSHNRGHVPPSSDSCMLVVVTLAFPDLRTLSDTWKR